MDDERTHPGGELTEPTAELAATEAASKITWKTWVGVSVTAAFVGAAAVFGIRAASSSDSTPAAVPGATPSGAGVPSDPGQTQPGQGSGASGKDAAGQGPAQAPGAGGTTGSLARGPGGFGTIASIDGSTLTITNPEGEATRVMTSSSTSVTTSDTGALGDIEVGDTVTVIGSGSPTKIAAARVTDDGKVAAGADDGFPAGGMRGNGPPGGGVSPMSGSGRPGGPMGGQAPGATGSMIGTRGVVQSVGDGSFTVTGVDGTEVSVTTSSSTVVTIATPANVSDLKVGDTIMVRGTEADGTITATSIREGVLGRPAM